MVLSAILTTALAPITGALFGASYGTAIRIGYEIIFPALFQNVKGEEGAKQTIKSLHEMFTATGGVAALEFGIDQGIAMAKKKTESPEVQHLISLDLGITEAQLQRKSATFENTGFKAESDQDVLFTSSGEYLRSGFESLQAMREKYRTYTLDQLQTIRKLTNGNVFSPEYQMATQIRNEKIQSGDIPQTDRDKGLTGDERGATSQEKAITEMEKQFIQLFSNHTHWLGQYQIQIGKPPQSNKIAQATVDRNIAKYKSLTLDAHKKIINFLTLAQNNPLTRVKAAQHIRNLGPALG